MWIGEKEVQHSSIEYNALTASPHKCKDEKVIHETVSNEYEEKSLLCLIHLT